MLDSLLTGKLPGVQRKDEKILTSEVTLGIPLLIETML